MGNAVVAINMGIAIGSISAMVPHEVPVITAVMSETIKNANGSKEIFIHCNKVLAKYCPVCRSSLSIAPKTDASVIIIIACTMSMNPSLIKRGICAMVVRLRRIALAKLITKLMMLAKKRTANGLLFCCNACRMVLVPPKRTQLPRYKMPIITLTMRLASGKIRSKSEPFIE